MSTSTRRILCYVSIAAFAIFCACMALMTASDDNILDGDLMVSNSVIYVQHDIVPVIPEPDTGCGMWCPPMDWGLTEGDAEGDLDAKRPASPSVL